MMSAPAAQPTKDQVHGSCGLKRLDAGLEIYVLISVPERLVNMSNPAHFDRFLSICVGDPFGPQVVGAFDSNCKKYGS